MRIGMGFGTSGSMVAGLSSAADSDATAYADAVVAAGGTVSAPQRSNLSAFFAGEKSAGRWTSIKRLYLPIWGDAEANAIDLKTLAVGTWAGTVTHGAGFAKGNGTTGRLATGLTPTTAGMTTLSAWLGYLRKDATATTPKGHGSYAAAFADPFRLNEAVGISYFDFTNYAQARVTNAPIHALEGIVSARSNNGTLTLRGRNSTGIVHAATSTPGGVYGGINTIELWFMAENFNGTGANFSDDEFGAFWIGTGVTDAADAAFTANLKSLWESLTGLVLP